MNFKQGSESNTISGGYSASSAGIPVSLLKGPLDNDSTDSVSQDPDTLLYFSTLSRFKKDFEFLVKKGGEKRPKGRSQIV